MISELSGVFTVTKRWSLKSEHITEKPAFHNIDNLEHLIPAQLEEDFKYSAEIAQLVMEHYIKNTMFY